MESSSFWNKLKKTIMTTPKAPPSSALQLSRFSKCWMVIQAAISTPEKRSVAIQQTEIPSRLKAMIDLLVDEESRLDDATGTTGVCMEHLLKNNVLAKLVSTCAEGDRPRGIIGETIRTIASMVNLLDDRFLVHNAVHNPTVKLLRTCCAPGTDQEGDESYHEDLIDLMYILCSKIHGYPELLNIFFHDKQWLTVPERVARRLQKSKETIAMLRSLSHQSNLALSNLDFNPPSSDKPVSGPPMAVEKETSIPTDAAPMAFGDGEQPDGTRQDTTDTSASKLQPSVDASKRDYEFLLFTYLSKFVHREGKAGDFARTGLLFLMELATGSLGEYILDTDFATYLTAGIGALYSQLPRKLIVQGGDENLPRTHTNNPADGAAAAAAAAAALPIEPKHSRRANIELSTSADFQSRLDAFLKVLEFCQDVLMRCPNTEIAATLLSSFKTIFLENILYPSILECSDTDGSSVAVISYIDQILQVIEHGALVDLVVGFLMESDDDDTSRIKDLEDTDAFAEVQNPQTTSPYFTALGRFTLKDLVLSRLKSRSQATVIATLKLLNTTITRHCKYSLKLLSIQPDLRALPLREQSSTSGKDPYRDIPMINHHAHELDLFFALIATINPCNTQEIFGCGYEAYLRDAEGTIQTHYCEARTGDDDSQHTADKGPISDAESKKQKRRSVKYGHRMDLLDDEPRSVSGQYDQGRSMDTKLATGCCGKGDISHENSLLTHRLSPSDPLLQILLGILQHFFAHTVELNLALTGVITSLAICPYRSLEGWLLFRTSDVKRPDVDRDSGEEESESELSPPLMASSHIFAELDATPQLTTTYDSDDEDTVPFFSKTLALTRSGPPSFKSFPPFFTMLRTLTQQVDYYRSEIDGFDEYLAERRRTLLLPVGDTSSIANINTYSRSAVDQSNTFSNGNSSNAFSPGFMHVSNDSILSTTSDPMSMGGARPSTPTMSSPSLTLFGAPTSPRILTSSGNSGAGSRVASPAPQRATSMSISHVSNSSVSTANITSSVTSTGNSGSSNKTPAPQAHQSLANPVTLVKVNTPRARKSSSPSSLMSTPSNMPFLVPPGISGGIKRNFKSNSASPLAGDSTYGASSGGNIGGGLRSRSGSVGGSGLAGGPRYPSSPVTASAMGDLAAEASTQQLQGQQQHPMPPRIMTKSPEPISQSRALWSSGYASATAGASTTPSSTATTAGSGSSSKTAGIGGMATVAFTPNAATTGPSLQINTNVIGTQGGATATSITSSSANTMSAFGSFSTNPLATIMNTMMIKPLFGDGFVDDSDCEAESNLHIKAKFHERESSDSSSNSERSGSGSGDDDERSQHRNSKDEDNDVGKTRRSRSCSREGSESEYDAIEREANSDLQEPSSRGKHGHGREQGRGDKATKATITTQTTATTKKKASATRPTPAPPQEKLVTLGQLLTNVVILEEVVKEVVAVAQVRKAMGVDKVRFL
ncbi:hypothetical protein BGZ99_002917 [Dissophora globulifera]|uniref:FHF complex subunit HOOK-interacting protein C-terminal domain-containing protein n=1 Tax=Dissophora globulifera TaxID=979702 RepID=A0A9P6UX22_9FUNG|nr:hypothetical protein BGZ99_002917 [Dissophora globulifera]